MTESTILVRSLGRWTLAALVLNTIIGTAVFVLPGTVAGRLGWMSLAAWVLAAACTGAMVLCFAEVASRFSAAGGAYLYTQLAFGRLAGIQVGWMTYLVRAISAAVQANVFALYLAEFWPWAATRYGELAITGLFIGLLAAINIRSVRSGARTSNVLAVVKLVPLLGFAVLGLIWIAAGRTGVAPVATDSNASGWLHVLLLLMFAYGGFESALLPMAEARNPRRDAPFALLLGLGLATLVYLAAQLTVLATVADPGATSRPLAVSARVMLGAGGAVVITVAALISVYGWLAANMLTVPRLTMAMAERGDLPAVIGRVHPTFRTPWISILLFAILSWLLANQAGLLQNISLSAVSRLFIYGLVCAALPALRRKERQGEVDVGSARFRAPLGGWMAMIGVGIALLLATRMNQREAIAMGVTVALATVHWLRVRGRAPRLETSVADNRQVSS
jgi:amino acid transporter